MPSELQRVARGLVDCFDEVPRVVEYLTRTAARCRENAQLALLASRGQATVAAQQLDAAARACEAAAHYLSMAPPKARGWAEGLIGDGSPSSNRPSSDSADRNRATGGVRDIDMAGQDERKTPENDSQPDEQEEKKRAERLTRDFEFRPDADGEDEAPEFEEPDEKEEEKRAERLTRDFEFGPDADGEDEVPEFEAGDEKEEEQRAERLIRDFEFGPDADSEGEVPEFEERDEKDDAERAERLTRDLELTTEQTGAAVRTLLDTIGESATEPPNATPITITTDRLEATVAPADSPHAEPVIEIDLPKTSNPGELDFDPAFDLRPLDDDFSPGTHDPHDAFKPHERLIAERLVEEGWRVDARPADHSSGKKNPDAVVRRHRGDEGAITEFKTPEAARSETVKRNMLRASAQALKVAGKLDARGEVVIDGRPAGLSEETALRGFRRALGQPGSTLAPVVHVILGDGRLVTFTKEQ